MPFDLTNHGDGGGNGGPGFHETSARLGDRQLKTSIGVMRSMEFEMYDGSVKDICEFCFIGTMLQQCVSFLVYRSLNDGDEIGEIMDSIGKLVTSGLAHGQEVHESYKDNDNG